MLLLAPLDPLFEQVLVVAVCARPQCEDPLSSELSAIGVDEHGHQAVLLALQLVDLPRHLAHRILQSNGEGYCAGVTSRERVTVRGSWPGRGLLSGGRGQGGSGGQSPD